jgi:BirA family biotin operon repressor/biotin-[acetyl-CoA-carboxylase] ligase
MEKEIWHIPVDHYKSIEVHHYLTIKSTNLQAVKLAREDPPEWTVISAAQQTAGKGRFQRQWQSPPGLGLYFSIILKPALNMKKLNLINLATALCLRQFLENLLPSNHRHAIKLKWPNDVLINRKKISGILLESGIKEDTLNHLVVGIGLNANQTLTDFSNELRSKATSLKIETNQIFNLKELLTNFLQVYHYSLNQEIYSDFKNTVTKYEEHLLFKNQQVEIGLKDKTIRGRLRGLDEFGYLKLASGNQELRLNSGDLWEIKEEEMK